jgi:acetyl-CoA carboxylase carboxyltransferase component
VAVLDSRVDLGSERFSANRDSMLELLAELDRQLELARAGGGERYVERHRARGKLLPRERIATLLDDGAELFELSPLAAWGTEYEVGASIVTGIGRVAEVECVFVANDPTVRGGATNPYTLKKNLRALAIARANRLPVIYLVESGGADLPRQAEIFLPGGAIFRDLTRLSAAGIPTLALVYGNSTAGGAYIPAMCDHSIMVDRRAKVFLGGPPLVKMAIGEDADDEELGGAEMHSRVSGLSDALAEDEHDAARIAREIVASLEWQKLGPGPTEPADRPLYDPEDLLGIASTDLRTPIEIRDVLARVVDGSRLEEYKPLYGAGLVTGWASIGGYRVGVVANDRGVLFSEESRKATEFIQLANRRDTPLLFVQNTTGYMVGRQAEQAGMVRHGALMINAVSNSAVPHVTLLAGASYGAGNYGMGGYAFDPRFVFAWPNAKTAVMGPRELAGVLSIVARAAAERSGRTFDEEADAAMRRTVEEQIESESRALFNTGHVYDDGVIDPRDTRRVLALALSACHSNVVRGTREFGIFRL